MKTSVPRAPRGPALVVFARAPVPGAAKTRLIPLLGPEAASRFQRALLSDTLSKARRVRATTLYIALAGRSRSLVSNFRKLPGNYGLIVVRQRGAGLGARLEKVFRDLLPRHSSVVVIGTDSPEISTRLLAGAFARLRRFQAVLGPCPDGGYYLIGLRRGIRPAALRAIFGGVRWSTRWALADTLKRISALGLARTLLEPCADIDLPRDFRRLAAAMAANPALRLRAPEAWRFLAGRSGPRANAPIAKNPGI